MVWERGVEFGSFWCCVDVALLRIFSCLAGDMVQLLRVLHRSRAATYGRDLLADIRL